jgi:hypothetical protein
MDIDCHLRGVCWVNVWATTSLPKRTRQLLSNICTSGWRFDWLGEEREGGTSAGAALGGGLGGLEDQRYRGRWEREVGICAVAVLRGEAGLEIGRGYWIRYPINVLSSPEGRGGTAFKLIPLNVCYRMTFLVVLHNAIPFWITLTHNRKMLGRCSFQSWRSAQQISVYRKFLCRELYSSL